MSDLDDLQRQLKAVSDGLEEFAETYLRKASARIAARAISEYMRDTGGTEGRRRSDDSGPLRIVSGRLSRSLASRGRNVDTGGQPEGIMSIEVAAGVVTLIKGSKVPYAPPHEYGFRGTQWVPSHPRRITQAFGKPIEPREVTVRAHTRKMALAERAYLHPALQDRLPLLQEMASDDLFDFLLKHLN